MIYQKTQTLVELHPGWEIKYCHTQAVCLCSPNHYLPFSSQEETTCESYSMHLLHMTFFGSVLWWSFSVLYCVIILKYLSILLLMDISNLEFLVLWLMLQWREPYYGPLLYIYCYLLYNHSLYKYWIKYVFIPFYNRMLNYVAKCLYKCIPGRIILQIYYSLSSPALDVAGLF